MEKDTAALTGGRSLDDRRMFRRAFLTLVARRQRPGAGSMLAALDRKTTVMEWWGEAERALQAVPHAVAGDVATNAYAPERLTRHIDFVVAAANAAQAEAALREAGWRPLGRLALVSGTSWQNDAGHELDLIELDEPWAQEAITAAQQNLIVGLPTLPLPYLVFMKLDAARTTDLADVSRMLGRATEQEVQAARQVISRFGDVQDLADFEQLLQMGRLERGFDGWER